MVTRAAATARTRLFKPQVREYTDMKRGSGGSQQQRGTPAAAANCRIFPELERK